MDKENSKMELQPEKVIQKSSPNFTFTEQTLAFLANPNLPKTEQFQICLEQFNNILGDVLSAYESDPVKVNSNVPNQNINSNQIQNPLQQKLQNQQAQNSKQKENQNDPEKITIEIEIEAPISLSNFVELHKQKIFCYREIKHYFTKKLHHFYHLQVHKQHTPNLCGYHASYNILEAVKLIKSQNLKSDYLLDSSVHFWKYLYSTQKFLQQWAKNVIKNEKIWPWGYYDTRIGDFERSYLKVLANNSPYYASILKSDNAFRIELIQWDYQFHHIINSVDEQRKMQKIFDEFVKFQDQDKHFIIVFMLGITNHWTSLMAHKCNDQIEFWLFDSRNKEYLDYNQDQIIKHIEEIQEQKRATNKPLLNKFKMMCYENCISDLQESVKIICECLVGNETLLDYTINSQFEVFGKSFNEQWNNETKEKFLNNQLNQQESLQMIEQINNFIVGNEHDIERFFKCDMNIVYLKNYNLDVVKQMHQLISKSVIMLKQLKIKIEQNVLNRLQNIMGSMDKKIDRSYQKNQYLTFLSPEQKQEQKPQ